MSIAEFIRDDVLRPRLKESGCLVVYDPHKRFRELCAGLATDKIRVIDVSSSSIESREAASAALIEVGQPTAMLESVLIYVPSQRPETDEQKQADPFALYAECGAIFPQSDGDDYLNLCLRAKPDYAVEIRKAFVSSPAGPSYAVVDAIGGGIAWPQLRAALSVESSREILAALLAPNATQREGMKSSDGWSKEAREYLTASLGMDLRTRSAAWDAIAEEIWRFVLFSEFAFDLPTELPEGLKGIPRARNDARPIIDDVCHRLRNDSRTRATYIGRAEGIEGTLDLPRLCKEITDLGVRDTFPFEERTFLRTAIDGVLSGDTDATRRVLTRQRESIWLGKGESQAQWELVRASLNLIEACEVLEGQLPDNSRTQAELLDFYLSSLREGDRLHREFEQAVSGSFDQGDWSAEVIEYARSHYRRLTEKTQIEFVRHLELQGWPPDGRLANADVFDRLVEVRLRDTGHKVAYILVDALRYELGVQLHKLLAEDGSVDLQAAYAQLPTITPVGMASLLPRAGTELNLALENDVLVPKLGGASVANVSQRMGALKQRFGDRFAEFTLNSFAHGKPKVEPTVDLLVIRSTEIDSHLESNPETTLSLLPGTLRLVRVALHKLRAMGFKDAVIVADHGFYLNAQAEAGDVCIKPQGNWPVNAHDRMLLGSGQSDAHSLVVAAAKLGIRGDFAQVALPRSMAPYRLGHLYFHGGASLPEAVVPVLVARLEGADPTQQGTSAKIEITYKNGATRITTRLPVIDVMLLRDDLFTQEKSVDILLEAQDARGNVVGEPRAGKDVDPATQTITLMPDQRKQIAIRMGDEFRGAFTVKALNPTTLATYKSLALETDYTE